ncbi:MAG: glycosyltransferase family 2 protein [Methylacidiphilales bacterium]|nr:glycosyltransferase family 2 protein [Candidatus Methylacidiphilales bacterium]
MIYFVTVNYYSGLLISQLIKSLPLTSDENKYKLIIVNNSPSDRSLENFASQTTLILDSGSNIGFGSACNFAIKWVYTQDTNATIWLINPDAYFVDSSYLQVESFLSNYPKISILGTIIRTPLNEIWFAGGRFSKLTGIIYSVDRLTNSDADYVNCDWISGCSLIINLRNFSECPLFDTNYFLYYEDFDFCQRYAREKHQIAITKQLNVVHQPSSITNQYIQQKIKHSTYSYLLTLERYTNILIFTIHFIKLIVSASILMFIKPKIALGKFQAIFLYWRDRIKASLSSIFRLN